LERSLVPSQRRRSRAAKKKSVVLAAGMEAARKRRIRRSFQSQGSGVCSTRSMKPGDLLASKYRLERVLGTGGMGKVWAAVNESTGRPVAVKLMHSPTPELRARMLREARAGGSLKHRNIVDIYDVGETESGDPFLVMERLSGETLEDRLERERSLPPAKAIEITASIAAALKVAHARGIVHRDLKPANVFLHREADGEGEIVKVLDFGVSKHLQENAGTLTAGLVGSPAYMSPEQARAEPKIDARADLWSLGVVLFEMLAGRRPFAASSLYLLITEVITGPIPNIAGVVPGLSPALVHVVERCLVRDVDARVGSADELIGLLGSSPHVDPPIEEEPTHRPSSAPMTTPPLVLAGEAAAPPPVAHRAGLGPVPSRGPSNAVVALVACASALVLILVFGAVLRRAPPAAKAAAAAATQPPEVTNTVAAVIPQPATTPASLDVKPASAPRTPEPAAQAPEAPASAQPAALPRLGKDEAMIVVDAPATTSVSLDGKRIGTVPVAPAVVLAGSHRVLFKHPTLGERVMVVEVQAGETSLATAPFGNDVGASAPRTHPSGEKRLVLP
jgi:serine/threonine-protein kinase